MKKMIIVLAMVLLATSSRAMGEVLTYNEEWEYGDVLEVIEEEGLNSVHIYKLSDGRALMILWVGESREEPSFFMAPKGSHKFKKAHTGNDYSYSGSRCGCEMYLGITSGELKSERTSSPQSSCNSLGAYECSLSWTDKNGGKTTAVEMERKELRNYEIRVTENGVAQLLPTFIPDPVIEADEEWASFLKGSNRCRSAEKLHEYYPETAGYDYYLGQNEVDMEFAEKYYSLFCEEQ